MIAPKLPVCPLGQCHAIFAKIQRLNATGCVTAEDCFFGGKQRRVDFQCCFSIQMYRPSITKAHPVSWPRSSTSGDLKPPRAGSWAHQRTLQLCVYSGTCG